MVYVTLGTLPDRIRIQVGSTDDAITLLNFIASINDCFTFTIEKDL